VEELPASAPLSTTTGFYPPAKKGSGIVLEGELNCLVDRLMEILHGKCTAVRL
jgi:electron transfer flavoprotein beta subunit